MEYTYTYKEQGDGRDSWICEAIQDGEVVEVVVIYFIIAEVWKLKAILNSDGLLTGVETALDNLPEPTKTNAAFAWNFAPEISSNSPTTELIKASLGLTDEQAIDIFQRATNFNI